MPVSERRAETRGVAESAARRVALMRSILMMQCERSEVEIDVCGEEDAVDEVPDVEGLDEKEEGYIYLGCHRISALARFVYFTAC